MATDPAVLDWLLDTDPALRWQVERDLAGEPPDVWQATRARVGTEGFGAALLSHQDEDGHWAGGAFFPRGYIESHPAGGGGDQGQPWTATTWSLTTLREWGLDASALDGTAEKLAANSRWEYDDLPYWDGEVDCCINAVTLANGAWLGVDMSRLAQWFVDHRLPDGGWNCAWVEGSTRSSFHSTLNTLKGLLAYEELTGASAPLDAARRGGQEYLLDRRLLYRLSTDELVGPWADCLAYPPRAFYNVLDAADHLRAAALFAGSDDSATGTSTPDPRMADAIAVIRDARQPDGRWLQERRHPGEVWFEVDVPAGEPSPWLTFVATRVLDWWEASPA